MRRRLRLLVSHRLSLTVAVALLVTITGLGIAVSSYRAGKATVHSLTATLFADVTERVAEQTRAFLSRAVAAGATIAALYAEDEAPLPPEQQARRLLAVLQSSDDFSRVSYADASGAAVGVYRTPDGTIRLSMSQIDAGGKTPLDEFNLTSDHRWTPHRHDDDTGYDPRKRPFYAIASKAKRPAWTPPYVVEQGIPGITHAVPIMDGDKVRGVLTLDFDIDALSELVRQVELSDNGRAFVFARDGTLIAHPTVELVTQEGKGAERHLVDVEDVGDPLLGAFLAAGGTSFESSGDRYLSARKEMSIDGGLSWAVGVYAPESDFTGSLRRRVVASLVISLLAVGLAVLLAAAIVRRISR